MQGEKEERTRKRRKKKSKFGYYLYAVIMLLLTITNITLALLLLTHVQKIEISGTELARESDIEAWIKEDAFTNNAIYTWWKYNFGTHEIPVYLESMHVSLGAPWKVTVKVEEKKIAGCVLKEDMYIYFDEKGLVLDKSAMLREEIPVVEGLEVNDAAEYEYLQVENEKIFSYVVEVASQLKKSQLVTDRLVWDDGMQLHFDGVCVTLGKTNFEEKILQLPPILEQLEGKEGTLKLEHYTSDSKNISFEQKTDEILKENLE